MKNPAGSGKHPPVVVGLGEIAFSNQPEDVLVIYGLGSCVGIGAWEPEGRVAGLLHAVLPRREDFREKPSPRYVNSGVDSLLGGMRMRGADTSRTVFWMAGGAHMLCAPAYDIGQQNVDVARAILTEHGIFPETEFVGGSLGRTMRLYVGEGRMTIDVVQAIVTD